MAAPKPAPRTLIKAMIRAWDEGQTLAEIAATFDRSIAWVGRKLRKSGVNTARRWPDWSPVRQRVIDARRKGLSFDAIAEELHIPLRVVTRLCYDEQLQRLPTAPGDRSLGANERAALIDLAQREPSLTRIELAARFQCSEPVVARVLNRAGILKKSLRRETQAIITDDSPTFKRLIGNVHTRLTTEQQLDLCRRYQAGESGTQLAAEFDMRPSAVYRILHARQAIKPLSDGMRRCLSCGHHKPLSEFKNVSTRPDLQYRTNICIDCGGRLHRGRRYALKWFTGLTASQYDELSILQGGVCAICGKHPTIKRLSVDHDHITGLIRGLLCNGCNTKLNALEDPEWHAKAEAYLYNPPAKDRQWMAGKDKLKRDALKKQATLS